MIESVADPHRGRCGRHHDRLRAPGSAAADVGKFNWLVAVADNETNSAVTVGVHLARALPARIDVWRGTVAVDHAASDFVNVDVACVDATGRDDAELVRHVRTVDLAIADADRTFGADRLSELSGRPCLAVPTGYHVGSLGTRALILWSDDRNSACALRDALPLLRDAECILVSADQHRGVRAEDAVRYLEAHGFEAFETGTGNLAELIQSEQIDLLIAGSPQRSAHATARNAGIACLISA